MAKTVTPEIGTAQQDETKKQRKKQAKKEARIMLKVDQAKKEVGKAQKKLTRAQSNLDESQTHLHTLEERLQQIRTPNHASQAPSDDSSEAQSEVPQTQEVIDEAYQEPLLVPDSTWYQADTEAPTEDHTDIITDSAPASTSFEEQPFIQTESDVPSYPSEEQNTPSPEAIAETDTTSPEDTTANDNKEPEKTIVATWADRETQE